MRAPSVASRSRTRGWRTATGPMTVMISRSGRWAWRTTRCWPVAVLRSLCFARNSATSASTAWVSSARAPLRRISVRESVKAPGWVSLITLLSDTAYHSFIGEVEALNTTTIRRLTRLRRHQLLAIAPQQQLSRKALFPTEWSDPARLGRGREGAKAQWADGHSSIPALSSLPFLYVYSVRLSAGY